MLFDQAYVKDLSVFLQVGSETSLTSAGDIDVRTSYVLLPKKVEPGSKVAILIEKKTLGAGRPLVLFSDGSIREEDGTDLTLRRQDPDLPRGGQGAGAAGNNRGQNQTAQPLASTSGSSKEQEPNNSLGTANTIAATGEIQGTIQPERDEDWYVFEVGRPGRLVLRVSQVPAKLALQLHVRNAEGGGISEVFKPAKPGAQTEGQVSIPTKGKYYVQVTDANNAASSEPYTLELRFQTADAYEPNNSVGTATPIKLSAEAPAAEVLASILPRGDVDWYQFEVPRRGALRVSLTQVPKELALQFQLHNAENGDLIGWINPLARGSDNLAVVDLPTAGRYYLVIKDVEDKAASPENYKLQLTYLPGDPAEPNDSFGTATPLSVSKEVQGTILPKGDQDWYVFQVTQTGTYEISVTNVPAELAIQVRILNAENGAIAETLKPTRAGAETRGTIKLPAAGKYYLHLYDGRNEGRSSQPYTLKVVPAASP
jgi:hypothetical protein